MSAPETSSTPPPDPAPEPPQPERRLPQPRDAVQRAHRVPRGFPDRSAYLRLDLGEEEAPASPRVAEALRNLSDAAFAHYPDPLPLQRALAEHHGVDPEEVSVCAGTDEAIRLVFGAFVEEGARVLLPRPAAGAYLAAAQAGGAFVDRVDYEDDLDFPLDAFRKQMLARPPRLAVVGNPNSPTGTALPRDALLELVQDAPGTLFVIDEVYVHYHGASVLDPAVRGRLAPNALVMRSFSKDHGLAGLRVGYFVGHPELLRAVAVVKPSYTLSAPSIAAARAALADEGAMHARVLERRRLSDRLVAALQLRGVEARTTRGAFVLVRLSPPVQAWAAAFAARRVLVGTRGHVGPLARWIRVTATADEHVERFLLVLDEILAEGPGATGEVPSDWDDSAEGMA